MESGALFVMTLGMILMLEWCALRWDIQDEVHDRVLQYMYTCTDIRATLISLHTQILKRDLQCNIHLS